MGTRVGCLLMHFLLKSDIRSLPWPKGAMEISISPICRRCWKKRKASGSTERPSGNGYVPAASAIGSEKCPNIAKKDPDLPVRESGSFLMALLIFGSVKKNPP